MNQSQSVYIVLGVIIIVALVLAPTVIQGFFNGIRDFFREFRDTWFEDWVNGNGNQSSTLGEDYSTLGLILHYEDGTKRDFKNDNAPLGLYEFAIYDDGKTLTEIEVYLRASVSYTGELTTWDVSSDLRCTVADGTELEWKSTTLSGNGQGEWNLEQEIWRTTIRMSELDSALKNAGWSGGTIWVWLYTTNRVTLHFKDGQDITKTGDANALLSLDFDPQNAKFNSLYLALYADPLLPYGDVEP